MKRVISKKTIKVGKKYYTEEKYWALFPSDRIITTRTRRIMMPLWKKIQKILSMILKVMGKFLYVIRELITAVLITAMTLILLSILLCMFTLTILLEYLQGSISWIYKKFSIN
jgi:hypothetical protein